MPSTFPGAIDSFTDPLSNSPLNSPSHSALHSDINDAVEKVEQYMGLVKVIPTSVAGTGVSLSATGTVTFSSATAISVNGCFTSLYDNYRLIVTTTSGSTDALMNLKLRAAGADTPGTTEYGFSLLQSASAGAWLNLNYSASTNIISIGYKRTVDRTSSNVDIHGPALAQFTGFSIMGQYQVIPFTGGGQHGLATAYDGFSIIPASGNVTGTLRIYGYRN